MYSISKTNDGILSIIENVEFAPTPTPAPTPAPSACSGIAFYDINDEYIVTIADITDVKSLDKFIDKTKGEIQSRYLGRYYRFTLDGINYTDWLTITNNSFDGFPCLDGDKITLEIKWVREGKNRNGIICLLSYEITGEWERKTVVKPEFRLAMGDEIIYKPNDVYKVFKLTNFELISNIVALTDLDLQYRISQDVGKTWTNWEYLTKSNITTLKINPTRFFYIEYKFKNIGTYPINIYDLNLIGEFQNVSKDYFKSNLFGMRQDGCCVTCLFSPKDATNDPYNGILSTPYDIIDNSGTNQYNSTGKPADCELPAVLANSMDTQTIASLYKPYDLTKATQLVNSLSNSTTQIFGHEVVYFLTSPDKLGIDTVFNEYQLFNVDCYKEIKVMVEENNFPDNQIKFNEFDLALFDQFEIHITKQMFKEAFGVEHRPAQQDFLYFCALNRMFQVSHAQPYKDFNNNAIYYKVMLTKYNQKSNVLPSNSSIEQRIAELTNNSTIDELLGKSIQDEVKAVANKQQQEPLTRDTVRLEIISKIEKELIENSSLIINKYHYDMGTTTYNTNAVTYKNADNLLNEGNNRSYSAWFKLNNYSLNEVFNFIDNYDMNYNIGYKINLFNDEFIVTINSNEYKLPYSQFNDDIWYCYTVNIDQRQRKIQQYLYKRNVTSENQAKTLRTPDLKLLASNEIDLILNEFELENVTMRILASDMKLTNIRIFNDVLPVDKHNNILNQNIVRDSDYLILGDNANKKLFLPRFDMNREV